MNKSNINLMQNLDFSNRIQKNYNSEEVMAEPSSSAIKNISLKKNFSGMAVLISLIFLAGVFTGFKISEITNIENEIIKYPEKDLVQENQKLPPSDSSTTFANPSSTPREAEGQDGSFLIKVGTFPSSTAESLSLRLNNDSDLAQVKPSKCKGVNENIPERYIAFRTRAGSQGENVFLGCFQKKWQAQNALKLLQDSKINGTGSARLFEIE